MKCTPRQIKKIMDDHEAYVNEHRRGVRADFRGKDLRGVSFREADLRWAKFQGANLQGADFQNSVLTCCNFQDAYLQDVDFSDAELEWANFQGSNLRWSNFQDSKLRNVDFRDANLRGVNFSGSDLQEANFSGANLSGANIEGTILNKCTGDRVHIKSLSLAAGYPVNYTSKVLQIGCEQHPISDWWNFSDDKIFQMEGKVALKFWLKYKEFIKLSIELSPAQPTVFEDVGENR